MASICSYSRVASGKTTSKRERQSVVAYPGSASASIRCGTGPVKTSLVPRHRALGCKSSPRKKTSRLPATHGDCPHGVLDDSARNGSRTVPYWAEIPKGADAEDEPRRRSTPLSDGQERGSFNG